MFSVEILHKYHVIKVKIEAGIHTQEEAKEISDTVSSEQRYFIGDFSYWMIVVHSDRPSGHNQCKLLAADILVRKVLGLKKVVIQMDPTDERCVGAALEIESVFRRNVEHVKIVHSETEALREFDAVEVR